MTFFIKTFGCQMNVNDSEKIRHLLEAKGLTVAAEERADIIIVNSCAVRAKPQEKIFSYVGRFPTGKKIIIAGCVAQAENEALFAKKVRVDYVVGTHQFYRIGEIVDELLAGGRPATAVGFSRRWQELVPAAEARSSAVTGYVSIMEGCDNFCSYCIVPFTRGREKHRPWPPSSAKPSTWPAAAIRRSSCWARTSTTGTSLLAASASPTCCGGSPVCRCPGSASSPPTPATTSRS